MYIMVGFYLFTYNICIFLDVVAFSDMLRILSIKVSFKKNNDLFLGWKLKLFLNQVHISLFVRPNILKLQMEICMCLRAPRYYQELPINVVRAPEVELLGGVADITVAKSNKAKSLELNKRLPIEKSKRITL